MADFFKGLWVAIKVIICIALVAFVAWIGYNVVIFFKSGKWSEGFQNIITAIQIDGGKGNGNIVGPADDVPNEDKGIIDDFTDDELDDFEDYLDHINDKTIGDDGSIPGDGSNPGSSGDKEKDYFDKDDYFPRDMITKDELRQSKGNVIKTFKYHGKDYLYFSMVFYTDELKSDKIRFFGYFPASDFKFSSDKLIYLIPVNTVKLFKLASDLNSWFNMKYPYPEISYHYFSNLKKVYEITPDKVSKSAFMNFSFDDYDLYLTHNKEQLKVVRGIHKFLGFIKVQPKQHELFQSLAEYFIYDNKFEYDKIYNFNFGKHLDYVGSSDRVQMDFSIKRYTCPCDIDETVFSEWTTILEPTCQAEGEEQRICYLCGKIETRKVERRAHYYNDPFENVPSTCKNHGHLKQQCKWCDDIYELELPLAPHDSEVISTEQNGCSKINHMRCKVCGEEYNDLISIHMIEKYVKIEPTCDTEGLYSYRCQYCHENLSNSTTNIEEVIPALGHDYGEYIQIEDTSIGERTCTNCGKKEVDFNHFSLPTMTMGVGFSGDAEHSYIRLYPYTDILTPSNFFSENFGNKFNVVISIYEINTTNLLKKSEVYSVDVNSSETHSIEFCFDDLNLGFEIIGIAVHIYSNNSNAYFFGVGGCPADFRPNFPCYSLYFNNI